METFKKIWIFPLAIVCLFNKALSIGETCYSVTDGEMSHSGYCSTSCHVGTLVPSKKCKNRERCCLPRIKGKINDLFSI